MCLGLIPACGCDACDGGAQPEIEQVDDAILPVVLGAFRRLSKGDRVITASGNGSWSATGVSARKVPAILAEPGGWDELSGSSWLGER